MIGPFGPRTKGENKDVHLKAVQILGNEKTERERSESSRLLAHHAPSAAQTLGPSTV